MGGLGNEESFSDSTVLYGSSVDWKLGLKLPLRLGSSERPNVSLTSTFPIVHAYVGMIWTSSTISYQTNKLLSYELGKHVPT